MATTKTTSRHSTSESKDTTTGLEAKVASLQADVAALRKELAAIKSAPAPTPIATTAGNWVDRDEWGKWRKKVAKKIGLRL